MVSFDQLQLDRWADDGGRVPDEEIWPAGEESPAPRRANANHPRPEGMPRRTPVKQHRWAQVASWILSGLVFLIAVGIALAAGCNNANASQTRGNQIEMPETRSIRADAIDCKAAANLDPQSEWVARTARTCGNGPGKLNTASESEPQSIRPTDPPCPTIPANTGKPHGVAPVFESANPGVGTSRTAGVRGAERHTLACKRQHLIKVGKKSYHFLHRLGVTLVVVTAPVDLVLLTLYVRRHGRRFPRVAICTVVLSIAAGGIALAWAVEHYLLPWILCLVRVGQVAYRDIRACSTT